MFKKWVKKSSHSDFWFWSVNYYFIHLTLRGRLLCSIFSPLKKYPKRFKSSYYCGYIRYFERHAFKATLERFRIINVVALVISHLLPSPEAAYLLNFASTLPWPNLNPLYCVGRNPSTTNTQTFVPQHTLKLKLI